MISHSSIQSMTTTVRARITRVYRCPQGKLFLKRELVFGHYCPYCKMEVRDVTFTVEAQTWLMFAGIDPIERKQ